MALLKKMIYALAHPAYLRHRMTLAFHGATNYDYGQWSRVVMYRELFAHIRRWEPGNLSALEISPGGSDSPWKRLGFADYVSIDFPEFDICKDKLERQFDVIIADQVFEHLLWPFRAARNVSSMLKTGGRFVCTTPFLIRVHDTPVDCSRWTETGLKYLLAEAGFELDKIGTGSWGNEACAHANLSERDWARVGWGKNLQNDADYPVAVWAIAEK